MIKRLTRHGNSLALVVDRAVLELLEIDETTPLALSTDGRNLIIAPARSPARRKRFRDAAAEGHRRYGRALKRLAE